MIWLYWHDIVRMVGKENEPARPPARVNSSEPSPAKRPQERILEEDRKKLEEILKRRS